MSRLAVVALLACLLLAGCSGPLGESTTTDAETTANATRAIAAPVSETGVTETTEATGESTTEQTATSATSAEETAAEETAADETVAEIEEASASGGTAGVDAAEVTTRTAPPETTNGTATNQTTTETYERNMPYEVRVSNSGTAHRNITVSVTAVNDSVAVFEVSTRFAPNETREFDFTVADPGEYEARVEVEGSVTTKRWDIETRDPKRALSVHVSSDGRVYVGFLDI
ncbi:hypothetical protein [Halorussus ruber]|uniref:hypothetical protein n=1 Tax=Halorussus ruber TaxID=1126238 RepID=UPI001091B716|nr:hypothetical protein [Halorussus ruber]